MFQVFVILFPTEIHSVHPKIYVLLYENTSILTPSCTRTNVNQEKKVHLLVTAIIFAVNASDDKKSAAKLLISCQKVIYVEKVVIIIYPNDKKCIKKW